MRAPAPAVIHAGRCPRTYSVTAHAAPDRAIDSTVAPDTKANPRAAELLGVPLDPGALVDASTTPEWAPLWSVDTGARLLGSPTVAGDVVVYGAEDFRVHVADVRHLRCSAA